jgi:hypothetical protein
VAARADGGVIDIGNTLGVTLAAEIVELVRPDDAAGSLAERLVAERHESPPWQFKAEVPISLRCRL